MEVSPAPETCSFQLMFSKSIEKWEGAVVSRMGVAGFLRFHNKFFFI
jgi:hypothetical protein